MTVEASVTVELPRSLQKAVGDFAAKEGVSVNAFLVRAVTEKIGARGTSEFFAERGKTGDPARAGAFLEGRPNGLD